MRGRFEICPGPPSSTTVTTDTVITPANLKRKRLVMFTVGSKNVWLGEGTAPIVGSGLVLLANAGSSMLWDHGCNLVLEEIRGTSSDGSPIVVSWREAL